VRWRKVGTTQSTVLPNGKDADIHKAFSRQQVPQKITAYPEVQVTSGGNVENVR